MSGSVDGCLPQQIEVTVTTGNEGAGHVSWVILVSNTGRTVCSLTGYPDVELLNPQGVRTGEVNHTPTGFSGGLPPGTALPRINLQRGEVASAVMEGTDVPPGNSTTCPSYPAYSVTLPVSGKTARIDQQIGSCSGLTVHPFVLGFNGTFPTGEVVGLAPRCQRPPSGEHSIGLGLLVQIDAWSGSHLAASVGVFSSSTGTATYRLIVKPGTYRIHSQGDRSSVHVVVHAGAVERLGLYGSCVQPTMPSTVPGFAPTTTTVPAA